MFTNWYAYPVKKCYSGGMFSQKIDSLISFFKRVPHGNETTAENQKIVTQEKTPLFHRKKLILATVTVTLLLFTGAAVHKFRGNSPNTYEGYTEDSQPENTLNLSSSIRAGKMLSSNQCEGEGVPYKLGRSPMDPDDFSIVIPYGLVIGGHVTPIDHQYFSPKDYNSSRDAYEVYAMADAWITNIEHRTGNIEHEGREISEYRLVFTITCTYFYYYDLVTSLAPEIQKEFELSRSGTYKKPLRIKVTEGQLIGRIGGQTLDFAVWDTTKPLSGFVLPEHYSPEPWKVYTADPLNYYTAELKEFILTRYVRTAEPVSGKIDHDIDGKMIGNWFLEGTVNYAGGKEFTTGGRDWVGHLSIVPEHIDPTGIIASFGDFQGKEQQFLVHHPEIRSEDVGIETGIVRYNLGDFTYIKPNGEHWDRNSVAKDLKVIPNGNPQHCLLLELVENRKLKVEYFPNIECSESLNFTQNAKFYLR